MFLPPSVIECLIHKSKVYDHWQFQYWGGAKGYEELISAVRSYPLLATNNAPKIAFIDSLSKNIIAPLIPRYNVKMRTWRVLNTTPEMRRVVTNHVKLSTSESFTLHHLSPKHLCMTFTIFARAFDAGFPPKTMWSSWNSSSWLAAVVSRDPHAND